MYMRSTAKDQRPVAAIDIGSNSIHMVIARIDETDHLTVLDSDKASVRLGQHLMPNGKLSQRGIQLACQTVSHMAQLAESYNAVIRAVATHTLRAATNQASILAAIQKQTGVAVEIVDGPEEARLVFLGMRYALPLERETVLGMDIGGGSTEFIVAKGDTVGFATSLKMGAVTYTKHFFGDGVPSKTALKRMHQDIAVKVESLLPAVKGHNYQKAIASSGTAKALASIHCRLFHNRMLSHENGYKLPAKQLDTIVQALEDLKAPKRIKQAFAVETARSQIILAGAIIMREASRLLHIKEWTITTYGLKEGIVVDTYRRIGGSRAGHSDDIRWSQVFQHGKSWGIDEHQAKQVSQLSLQIFDQLKDHMGHFVSDDQSHIWMIDRDVLRIASWLHECGKFINHSGYHRHGYYLLNHCNLIGFTQEERHMIGLVILFHRKNNPKFDSDELKGLPHGDYERVAFLSGILRMSAALCRTRQRKISQIKIKRSTIRRNGHRFGQFFLKFSQPKQTSGHFRVEFQQLEREIPALERSWHWKIDFQTQKALFIGVEKILSKRQNQLQKTTDQRPLPKKSKLKLKKHVKKASSLKKSSKKK
jgi:exopolyphosphatase / guanosine-5'-triphosphate,3'-diphosphate pyrophosphatase